jgi:hypothetical protein
MHINNWRQQEKLRVSISYIYETQFHDSYLNGTMQLQTGGSDGILVRVAKILHIHKTHYITVKQVVKETILCLKLGEDYEPERRPYVCLSRRKIEEDSLAMHLITCIKEKGASYRLTTEIYNALVTGPQNLPPVYYSAIYRAITESNHKTTRTSKRCQASDRNTMWRQARFNACSQLLVRLGGTMPSDTNGAVVSDPAAIDPDRIKEAGLDLELEQIAWWDEKHIPQVVGEINDNNYHFAKDENGIYDPSAKLEVTQKVRLIFANIYINQKNYKLTFICSTVKI